MDAETGQAAGGFDKMPSLTGLVAAGLIVLTSTSCSSQASHVSGVAQPAGQTNHGYCETLSVLPTGLQNSITQVGLGASTADDAKVLSGAAAQLRVVAATGKAPDGLRDALAHAADRLDDLNRVDAPSEAQVDALSQSLQQLGEELDKQCAK